MRAGTATVCVVTFRLALCLDLRISHCEVPRVVADQGKVDGIALLYALSIVFVALPCAVNLVILVSVVYKASPLLSPACLLLSHAWPSMHPRPDCFLLYLRHANGVACQPCRVLA